MAARAAGAADQTVYSAWVRGLELALSGTGWVSGAVPSEKAPTPSMTVSLTAGTYRISGTSYTSLAQDVTISAAHATLTRTDLVSMDSTGTATVTAGTPAAAPGSGVNYADPPDLPANHIPIALVEVAAGVSSVLDARIVDIRSIIPLSKDLIDAKGDLLAGTASDTISRLAVGANGTVLEADSTQATGLKWGDDPIRKSLIDAKGDLIAGTAADTAARVAVGTDGQLLRSDSAASAGVSWVTHDSTGDPHTQYPTQTEYDAHVAATAAHGATGAVVGTTNTQTLTNKTLTSPVINTGATGTGIGPSAGLIAAGDHTTPAATATTAGHVPTPPNNTTTFLRGDMTFAAPSGGWDKACRVFNSADISISNITTTALTFDSERYDTDTMHSTVTNTSRITFTTAGVYAITGQAQFAANSTGIRVLQIRVNGTNSICLARESAPSGTQTTDLEVSTHYKAAANDYVELTVYQSSGGALNVNFIADYTPEFMAVKVATG